MHVVSSENSGLTVRTHPALLAQLIDSMLDNAVKHPPPGSPIELRLHDEAGRAVLAVSDHGPGIDPRDLPHVFEPFYRSAEARRKGINGTGLGLAVARRIATALGGDIRRKT